MGRMDKFNHKYDVCFGNWDVCFRCSFGKKQCFWSRRLSLFTLWSGGGLEWNGLLWRVSITNRFKSCQKEDTTNNGYLSFMTHINGSIAFSFCWQSTELEYVTMSLWVVFFHNPYPATISLPTTIFTISSSSSSFWLRRTSSANASSQLINLNP